MSKYTLAEHAAYSLCDVLYGPSWQRTAITFDAVAWIKCNDTYRKMFQFLNPLFGE